MLSGTPTSFVGSPFALSVKAANGNTPDATQNFTLTVNAAPTFTTQPLATKTVVEGATTTLTAAAIGSPTPSIKWQVKLGSEFADVAEGPMYSGVATGTLTITGQRALNGCIHRALATNSVGSTPSNESTLTVNYPAGILTPPANQKVNLGTNVTFTAAAEGSPAPSFKWKFNNADIAGATNASLTINNATGANAGTYTVVAANGIGADATASATLSFNPAFGGFTPTSGTQGNTVTINGAGFTGATGVSFNGVPVPAGQFTVVSDFQITAIVPGHATHGPISVTPATGAALTSTEHFMVVPGLRLVAMSQRANSLGNESALMGTIAIEGPTAKAVLIRAIGPSLPSGTDLLADPFLTLYNSSGAIVATNNDWDAAIAAHVNPAGAIQLAAGSKDAAVYTTLQPGTYTARVASNQGGPPGNALLEVYESDTVERIAYLSNRAVVPAGGKAITALTLGGDTSAGAAKTVLIRALGAGGGVGTPVAHPNPVLTVKTVGATPTELATNDNWTSNTNSTEITAATATAGAMPLGNNDAAVLLTLTAGTYSIEVSGSGTTSGAILTEVHVVDMFRPTSFPPALLAPLHPQAADLNATVTFAAPFIGKPAPAFKWQKDQVDIAGASSAVLTLTGVTSANTAKYRVILDNTGGTTTAGTAVVTSPEVQLDVNKAPQTITFATLADKTYGTDTSFTISASTTSKLPITFTSLSTGVATIGNVSTDTGTGVTTATVTIVGAGDTSIVAAQAGNLDFQAAVDVTQPLKVKKGAATIVLGGTSATYDGSAKAVTATTTPTGLNVAITYTPTGGTAQTTAPANAGTYAVSATINDNNYAGTQTGTLTIAKATITIGLSGLTHTYDGTAKTATLTVPKNATNGDIPVTVTYAGSATAPINAGTYAVVASVAATEPNYLGTASGNLVINQAAATVALTTASLAQTYDGTPRVVTATTAPAGLNVVFTYKVAGSSDTPVTTAPTNAGSYDVFANVVEPNYTGSAQGTLVVAKADQTINASTIPTSRALDQSPVTLTATASSGLGVTYALTNNQPAVAGNTVATIADNVITLLNRGSIDLVMTQVGNPNFNPAPSVTRTLGVTNQSQTLTFAATQLPAKVFGQDPFTITASSNRKLQITFVSGEPTRATVTNPQFNATTGETSATVTIVGAGDVTITATQAGDDNTAQADPVPQVLKIAKADQTITFTAPTTKTYLDVPFALTAMTTATGLTPVFTVVSGPATVAGHMLTLTGAGTVVVRASEPGTANYNKAPDVDRTITVAKAAQTIAFTLGSPVLVDAGAIALNGVASPSALVVLYTSSNPGVAVVDGANIIVKGLGTTTITAKQAGNDNFLAATDVAQTLVVNPVKPAITLPSAAATAIVGRSFLYGPIGVNALSAPRTFSISGAPVGLAVDPATGNISGTPTSANTATNYTVSITATNVTGNDTKSFTLTLNPPAPVFSSAAASAATAGSTFSYTMAASNASSFTIDNLPTWLTRTGDTLSGTPPASGTYTFNITATNTTGSITLPFTITVSLPTNAPVFSGPTNPSGKAGDAFSFTPSFGAAGTATTTYAITGPLPPNFAFSTTTGAITASNTQNATVGEFPVTVTATRTLAGTGGWTLSASVDLTITINPAATAPVISFPSPGNVRTIAVGETLTSFTLTATPTATSFTVLTETGSELPTGITVSNTGVVAGTVATSVVPRTYVAKIRASNTAGAGPAASLQFTVNPHAQAPVITSAPVINGRVGVDLTPVYTITATPTTAGNITFSHTGTLPADLTRTGSTISGKPAAGTAGQHKIFVAGTNDNGQGTPLEITLNIALPLNVPVITSNGTASAQVGQPFSYGIVATNGPTSFSATPTSANGLTFNAAAGTIVGVPSAPTAPGTTLTFTLVASNADGPSTAKTLAITIAPAPATPVITSALTATGRVGLAFTYKIVANESPTSYVATGLPAGLSLNNVDGTISGMPTVAGTFTAKIRAQNAAGLGAESELKFTIGAAPAAPAISSPAAASGQVGVAFVYNISTTGGTATSYAAIGTLPGGVTLNSSTGAITGSPTAPGTFNVSLTASGEGGTSLPQQLTITIKAALGVPQITSSQNAAATVGVAFTYTITASNMGVTAFPPSPSFPPGTELDAVLPAGLGLAVNPSTGVIEGVPQVAGTFTVSLYGKNAAGTGPTSALTITVAPPLTAPVVNPPDAVSTQAGTSFSFQISASNSPSSYEVLNAPLWMTLNAATGAIAGVPDAPGRVTVKRVATNAAGSSMARDLTIDIAAAANTPVITGVREITGTVGVALADYTADALPAATSWVSTPLPPGLSLNPATGKITGTPTASTDGYFISLSGVNANGIGTPATIKFVIAPSFTITPK